MSAVPRIRGEDGRSYLWLGVLGSGAAGIVVDAIREDDLRAFAIKVARAGEDPRMRSEFDKSLRATHPRFVRMEEVLRFGGHDALVMERIVGVPSSHLGADALGLSRRALCELGSQLLEPFLAQPGLIHNDLKPENVLIERDGEARVVDFGGMRLRGEDTGTEGASERTKDFGAPERWLPNRSTQRSDLYSIGAILVVLMHGRRNAAQLTTLARQLGASEDPLDQLLAKLVSDYPGDRGTLEEASAAFQELRGRYPDEPDLASTAAAYFERVSGAVRASAKDLHLFEDLLGELHAAGAVLGEVATEDVPEPVSSESDVETLPRAPTSLGEAEPEPDTDREAGQAAVVALGDAAELLDGVEGVHVLKVARRSHPSVDRAVARIGQTGAEALRWQISASDRLWHGAAAVSALRDLEAVPPSKPMVLLAALDEPSLPLVARALAARPGPLAVLVLRFEDGAIAWSNDAVLAELQRIHRIHRVDATETSDVSALIGPAERLMSRPGPAIPSVPVELNIGRLAVSLAGRGAAPLWRPSRTQLPLTQELSELANVIWVRKAFRSLGAKPQEPREAKAGGGGAWDLDAVFDPLHSGLARVRDDDVKVYEHIEVNVRSFESRFQGLITAIKDEDRKDFEHFQSRSVVGIESTGEQLRHLLRPGASETLEDLAAWAFRLLKGKPIVADEEVEVQAGRLGLAEHDDALGSWRRTQARERLDALGVPEGPPPSWVDLFVDLHSLKDCKKGELRHPIIVEHQLRHRVDKAYDAWRARYQRVMRLVAERLTGEDAMKSWGREAVLRFAEVISQYRSALAELDGVLTERIQALALRCRRADAMIRAVSTDEAELVARLERFPLDADEHASIIAAAEVLLESCSLNEMPDPERARDFRARAEALADRLPRAGFGRLWSGILVEGEQTLEAELFGGATRGRHVRLPERCDARLFEALEAAGLVVEPWERPVGDAFAWLRASDARLSREETALELSDVHELGDGLLPPPTGDTASRLYAQVEAAGLVVAGLALGELKARRTGGLWRVIDLHAELTRKRAWLPTHAVGCIAAEEDGRADFQERLMGRARGLGRDLDIDAARILHGFAEDGFPAAVRGDLGLPEELGEAVALWLRRASFTVIAEAMDRHSATRIESALSKPIARVLSIQDLAGLGEPDDPNGGTP